MTPQIVTNSVGYAELSGTGGNISVGPTALQGIFVSSASGTPTITIYDDAATGTTTPIVPTFTPVAGTYYPLPFRALNGLNVVIGGTVTGVAGITPEGMK
jgi:hypothetical protein